MSLVIANTTIFTGDPARPWAEALCIENNRIARVGSNAEVLAEAPKSAEVLNLPGRLVAPGLVDAHAHFLIYGLTLTRVQLQGLTTLDACLERIRAKAAGLKPGEWIVGQGWSDHLWNGAPEPDRRDLDRAAPANPALMVKMDGHTVWVNSLALDLAGITADTPDPAGGRIERDPTDRAPTGLLREARLLIEKYMPRPTLEDWQAAALAAQAEALSLGITGVHSCEGLAQFQALAALERDGRLKPRVHHLLPFHELERARNQGLKSGLGSDRLWLSHAKLFADGSLGSGTALLHEPYADNPDQFGIAAKSQAELAENVIAAHRLGWDVAIHAIGDRAVTHCLLAIQASRARGSGDTRDRIEHVQLLKPDDLALFRDLGVSASVQPSFVPTDWKIAQRKWGLDRCGRAYPWKTLLTAGVPLLFGSDAPCDRFSPLDGLKAAVTRQTDEGQPEGGWFPEERLSLEQALVAYTRPAAWSSRRADRLGAVAIGMLADLTVFDRNLFRLPPEEWLSASVEMTLVDGEIVYRK